MRSHKELLAWQRARENALAIFAHTEATWTASRSVLIDQVRRAALSVMLNISEGYAHGPGPKFRSHLRIAYGSAVETTDSLEFMASTEAGLDEMIQRSREVQALTLRLWLRSRRA